MNPDLVPTSLEVQGDVTATSVTTALPASELFEIRTALRRRQQIIWTAVSIALSLIFVTVILIIFVQTQRQRAEDKKQLNATTSIPLEGIHTSELGQIGQLDVNGQMRINGSIVLQPTEAPVNAQVGQMYFDKTTKKVVFYDGSQYRVIAIDDPTDTDDATPPVQIDNGVKVESIAGRSGNIQLGNGLIMTNGTLSILPIALGVASVQGQTGAVTLTGSTGININGTTITNTGVISIAGQSGAFTTGRGIDVTNGVISSGVTITSANSNLDITDDGQGHYTIEYPGAGASGMVSLGPVVPQMDASNNDAISVNKTGTANFIRMATNGTDRFVVDQLGNIAIGTIAYSQVTGAPATVIEALTDGVNTAVGTISIGSGLVLTGNTLSSSVAGIGAVNGTTNQVNASTVSGVVSLSLPQDIHSGATPTFAGINTNAITPSGALTIGVSGQSFALQGSAASNISVSGGGFTTTVGFAGSPTGAVVYNFDRTASAGTYMICTTAGNCSGVGGGTTTPGGTNNTLAKFTGTQTLSNSIITDDGTLVTIGGNLNVTGSLTLGAALDINQGGTGATSASAARSNLGAAASGANSDITSLSGLTTALSVGQGGTGVVALNANGVLFGNGTSAISSLVAASDGQCLISTTGAPVWQVCPGAGGVTTLNGLSGAISLANATAAGSTVTIDDASTTQKGIAQFNSTNFSASNGVVNTVQDIAVTSTPTFASLTLTAALSVGNGGTGAASLAANGVLVGNGTGAIASVAAVGTGLCLVSTAGQPVWQACPGDGGVDSLNGLTGALNIANATAAGSTVTIDDASTTQKGIAQFNSTNFSASNGVVNTVQDIAVTSTPTFAGINTNAITPSAALGVGSAAQTLTLQGTTVTFNNNGATYTFSSASSGSYTICTTEGNCIGGTASAPNAATYLVASLNGTLTNERALNAGSNISFTDGGANGNFTVATVQNPAFTTSVTTPMLQSSGALVISSAAGQAITIDAGTTIELQDNTNVAGSIDIANGLVAGTGDAFQVNASGAITAATGITTGGTVTFSGYNCTTNANGGKLTTDGSGQIICSDDNGGAGSSITGTGSNGTLAMFTGAQTIANSILSQSGTTITIAGDLTLNTALAVANGGTGATSFTSNGVLYGNGTGTLQVTAAGTSGQVLVANGSGIPTFVAFSGDVAVTDTGATAIQPNSVSLGTDTAGNYVATLGTLTGLSTSGNTGEGSAPTLSVIYGSIAGTAVQGDTVLTCPGGTGNLTGGGNNVTLGAGGSCGNISIVNNPTFTTSVTSSSFILTGAGSNGTVQIANLGQVTAYTLPDPGVASATICLSTGNCATAGAAGGDLTGTYPNPTIASLQGTNLTIAAPSGGHILTYNATNGAWENHAVGGDLAISETGVTTIQANAVALGTDTTGDYVAGLGTLTGLSATGNSGEGSAPTLSVLYGSTANTAVQGSTTATVTAGTGLSGGGSITLGAGGSVSLGVAYGSTASTSVEGNTSISVSAGTNLTGGGSITLGAGGTVTLNVSNSPTFSGTLAVQGSTITVGTAGQQGSVVFNDGSSNTGTVQTAALGQNTVLTIPDPGAGSANFCLSTGNCATAGAAGGDLTGTYPNPTIASLQGSTLNITIPTAGHVLIYNGTNGQWENQAITGDIVISETGVGTIQANAVALGTDTTGNYVATIGTLTGLSTSGNTGEGSTPTLAVLYGSTANTSVQGNTTATVTAGTGLGGGGTVTLGAGGSVSLNVAYGSSAGTSVEGNTSISVSAGTNLTGGGSITLGAGGTVTLNVSNSPTFSGTLTVQGTSATIGTTSQQGSLVLHDGSSNTGTFQTAALGQNTTYTLPDPGAGTATICLSTGNCAGSGGGVTTPGGTNNRVSKFTGAQTLGDSSISDDGTDVTINGTANLIVQGGNATIGTLAQAGTLLISDGSSNTVSIVTSGLAADRTYTLPDVGGAATFCLSTGNCVGGGGGAPNNAAYLVASLNGTLSDERALNAGSNISLTDGGAGGNFTVATVQNPTFTTSVTTPMLQSSGALVISSAAGNTVAIDAGTTIELQDSTNVTGALDVSTGFMSGTGNAFQVDASGAITAATGITSSGTITFGALNCTTYANGGSLTANGSGQLVCSDDDGGAGSSITGTGTSGTLAIFSGAQTIADSIITQSGTTITITGDLNLTSALTVANGGTGAGTFTSNGVLYGNGTGALQVTAAGGSGQVLVANGSGIPTFVSFSGDVAVSDTGTTTIQPNSVALGTDTTGNYVANLGTLTGLSAAGNSGEGSTPTISVDYGSAANTSVQGNTTATVTASTGLGGGGTITLGAGGSVSLNVAYGSSIGTAVQGNTTLTCASGAGNLTGGGNAITLGSGGTCNNISIVSNPTFTTSVTTPSLVLTGAGSNGAIQVANLGQATTYTLPDPGSASATICLSTGNCATAGTAGGDLTGSYPNPTIASLQGTNLAITSPTAGQVLVYNTTNGQWENRSVSSDVVISETGVATIQANSVALGTDTTGNYVANLGTLTGLSTSGNTGEGSTPTLSVTYGSTANTSVQGSTTATVTAGTGLGGGGTITLGAGGSVSLNVTYGSSAGTAVQGNTTLTCPSGTGNLTGGGTSITLGTGGTCGAINTVNNPTFTTSVTSPSFILTGAGSNGTVQVASLGQATTFTIPDPGVASATFCLSNGNCAAAGTAGGDLTGSYPNPTIASLQGSNLSITSPTAGQVLVYNNTNGQWENRSISSDIVISETGVATIQANSVALGTDTTGNYVATIGTLTGLSATGNTGEGSTPTLTVLYGSTSNTAVQGNTTATVTAGTGLGGGGTITLGAGGSVSLNVAYGSAAGTAVQGNTTLTCPSGTGNLTGGGTSITLGTGGTCGALSTVNNPAFTTSVTTPSMILTGAGSNGTIQVANLGQATTFTLPDPGAGTASFCLSTGNCAASGTAGGDLTGSYPNPTIAKLQGSDITITSPTAGHVLVYNGTSSRWENRAISSDIAISETGVATIQANSIALGTDTVGNYVATIGTLTGLSTSGNTGEGSTPTLGVLYGSTSNTAVQGNTTATVTAGTGLGGGGTITLGAGGSVSLNVAYGSAAGTAVQGNTTTTVTAGTNLTGGGTITLGTGGTVTLNVASSPTFSGTLTVQGASATIGTSSQQGSLILNDGSSNTGTIRTSALALDTIYNLPYPAGGGTVDVCISTGNCTSTGPAGGDLTGTYPNPTIAELQGATLTVTSSASGNILQYNGSAWVNQSLSGDVVLNASGVATIQANAVGGNEISDGSIANADLSSGTYGNITGTGVLAAGSINTGFGSIVTTNAIQGSTGTFTGATSLTLGTSTSQTGRIVFRGAVGNGTLTVAGPTTPNVGNFTLTLPTITADATVCTTNSVCTGYAPSTGGTGYILNQSSPQQASSNFWISGTGRADGGINTPQITTASGNLTLQPATGVVSLGGSDTLTANGGFTIATGTNSTLTVNANGTGTLNLGSNATSGRVINIGATGSQANTSTVNIGSSSGAAQTVNLGSTNGASATAIYAGTGNLLLQTNSSSAAIIIRSVLDSTNAIQFRDSLNNPIVTVDTVNNNLTVMGGITTNTFDGAGLTDCDAQNSKLLWDVTTETFSCGTDRASVTIRKGPSDQSAASDITVNNDSEFFFTVGANETWAFQMFFDVNSPAAADFRSRFDAPAGSTCRISTNNLFNPSFTYATSCGSGGENINDQTSTFDNAYIVHGTIVTGGTGGTVNFRWAQGTSSGTSTIVRAGGQMIAYKISGADLAEAYYTKDNTIMPGDVVQIDGTLPAGVKKSTSAYNGQALGIVSTQPGMILGDPTDALSGNKPVLLALNGRVPVKISMENGPVEAGDYLTTSSTPGYAMKATRAGPTIGKALESYTGSGNGVVLAFVELGYYNPESGLQGSAEYQNLNIMGEATINNLIATNATINNSLTVNGTLKVMGLTDVETIRVGAHIITAGAAPQVSAETAAGAGAVVTIKGNDTAGRIEIKTGADPNADVLAKILFSKSFSDMPQVVITPVGKSGAMAQSYVDSISNSGFMVGAGQPAANTTYVFTYHVLSSQEL